LITFRKHFFNDGAYLDPWISNARSLVILPDSTAPTQAASSFSVKSKSLALSSNLALDKRKIRFNFLTTASSILRCFKTNSVDLQNHKYIPVGKSSWPSKNRGNTVCAGFTTFLVNPVMPSNCAMGCLGLYGLSIRAHLNHTTFNKVKDERKQYVNLLDVTAISLCKSLPPTLAITYFL